jgi:glycosyltransferase involved in cell wall biosynthesis
MNDTLNEIPVISVVTVVFNGKDHLETTIQSVVAQSYTNLEFVIIDGKSTDGTVEIIKRYESKIARWVSEPDNGIYDAMNKAVGMVTGKWVIFMNSGDTFFEASTVEKAAEALRTSPTKLIVYGDAAVKTSRQQWIQYQGGRHFRLERSIIHQSMFIRRDFLKAHPYTVDFKTMADYDSLLSISVPSPAALRHIDQVICVYDKTGFSSRPLYKYFKEYYTIAWKRMPLSKFISFNLYILPRLLWSLRLVWRKAG